MYGIAFLDSRWQATLAGLEGLTFLGFALWLGPRTLGGRGQLAALAGRAQRLAQTRQDAVDVAAAELRRVLELMAEGRSNSAIAQRLFITDKSVSKHSTSIFAKLDLTPSDDDNRRVLAILAYLNS
jgi:DNA-binding NarL/FixJ family response regulator